MSGPSPSHLEQVDMVGVEAILSSDPMDHSHDVLDGVLAVVVQTSKGHAVIQSVEPKRRRILTPPLYADMVHDLVLVEEDQSDLLTPLQLGSSGALVQLPSVGDPAFPSSTTAVRNCISGENETLMIEGNNVHETGVQYGKTTSPKEWTRQSL